MRIWTYLFLQCLKSTLAVLLFSLVLYFILTYMEENQHYFDGYPVTNQILFFYYFWQIPSVTLQLLPFATLIGAIITNWLLARHGEVAALRAAGMSMMEIARPLLCVGLFLSLCQFVLSELVLPYSSTQFQVVKKVQVERKKSDKIFMESSWLKGENTVLHYDKYLEDTQTLTNAEFFVLNDTHALVKQIVHAKSATFNTSIQSWVLNLALITHFNLDAKVIQTNIKPFYVTNIDFAPPKVLKKSSESSQLSYWQLSKLIQEAQLAGTNVSDRLVDLHMKLSGPFACLLFIFLALPFALHKDRQEDNYIGIVVCLAAALLYWFGNLSLRGLAIKGMLNPIVAAWAMNVLVAFLSYVLVRKLDKGQ